MKPMVSTQRLRNIIDERRERLGMLPQASLKKKGLKKKGLKKKGRNRVLSAIILVAFLFSAATMFILSPTVTRSIASLDNNMDMVMGVGSREKNKMKKSKSHKNNPLAGKNAMMNNHESERQPPTLPPEAPRSTISDLVTWMLSKNDKDVGTQHAALPRFNDSPTVSLEFSPGTLSLTHAQTLQHCFADPNVYIKHVQGNRKDGSNVPVSYSGKHKLAYVMLPKSGSSTARYMLKDKFHASETSLNLQPGSFRKGGHMAGVEVISFVRDPLSRFFSQYDEAYVRTAPWQKGSNAFYVDPDTKKQRTPHPFPYLFENIHSYHDYEDVFCPIASRKSRKDCIFRQSAENGTLARRLERFVGEYDGRDPFDVHLTLQVPMMSMTNGRPLHMTQIYNTTDSEGGWKHIAKQFLGESGFGKKGDEKSDVIAGRSYPRRFNSGLVSVETQRRICELSLLDYCCLNLPLPDVCKGQHYFVAGNDASRRELFCVLDKKGQIQPGIFPEKRKG